MQVLCFLVGSLSLISVRRQKMSNATLFDQRRVARRSSNMVLDDDTNDNDGDGEIEFPRVNHPEDTGDNREETVALTATPLDVV